ncbi:hypothetical protein EB796_008323 [Bugula neritina]|uniref:Uncharacterized protein n=1 Tax=Bugula neritina TaxID=10212 RepID=A0A7J7K5C3_BUGNE|nr:hypothetical protein EB796_008323 [Bugula neritina]
MNMQHINIRSKIFKAWSEVVTVLQSCNHAGNFFIYVVANSTLRKNFLQKFKRDKLVVCVGRRTLSV